MKMKTDQIKPIFHNLIDDRAYEFIAKKVSMMNGDIRVAFDYMKTALSVLADDLAKEMPEDNKIKISVNHMLRIYEQKNGSKVGQVLANLPRQDTIVLHAAALLFGDNGEEKSAQLKSLFEETELECEVREAGKMDMKQFLNCIDELEFYNLIKLERNKRDPKLSLVSLNVGLEDLTRELAALQTPDTHIGK